MSVSAQIPQDTLLASSGGSGSSTLLAIVIAAAVIGLIAVFALVGQAARPTVVVMERPLSSIGSVIGVLVIAIAVGIFFFTVVAPGSGSV